MRCETWNPKIILPLESGRPEGEWGDALQSSRFFLPIGIMPLTQGQFIRYHQDRAVQEVILHWVYKKKWNPAHKITDDRKLQKELKLLEPVSEVFLAWINLCEALHTFTSIGYRSAGDWFSLISMEIHKETMQNCLTEGDRSIFYPGNASRIARRLSKGINPFNLDENFHQWNAVQAALNAEKSHPLIYKTLLKGSQRQKPHLGLAAAYSAFEVSKEKDGHRTFEIKDGVLMIISGRGKSRIRLSLDPVQKSIAEKPT